MCYWTFPTNTTITAQYLIGKCKRCVYLGRRVYSRGGSREDLIVPRLSEDAENRREKSCEYTNDPEPPRHVTDSIQDCNGYSQNSDCHESGE